MNIGKRIPAEERERVRNERLAETDANAESPLAKFARVWPASGCICPEDDLLDECPEHGR